MTLCSEGLQFSSRFGGLIDEVFYGVDLYYSVITFPMFSDLTAPISRSCNSRLCSGIYNLEWNLSGECYQCKLWRSKRCLHCWCKYNGWFVVTVMTSFLLGNPSLVTYYGGANSDSGRDIVIDSDAYVFRPRGLTIFKKTCLYNRPNDLQYSNYWSLQD